MSEKSYYLCSLSRKPSVYHNISLSRNGECPCKCVENHMSKWDEPRRSARNIHAINAGDHGGVSLFQGEKDRSGR
jgi:hypothetical protein